MIVTVKTYSCMRTKYHLSGHNTWQKRVFYCSMNCRSKSHTTADQLGLGHLDVRLRREVPREIHHPAINPGPRRCWGKGGPDCLPREPDERLGLPSSNGGQAYRSLGRAVPPPTSHPWTWVGSLRSRNTIKTVNGKVPTSEGHAAPNLLTPPAGSAEGKSSPVTHQRAALLFCPSGGRSGVHCRPEGHPTDTTAHEVSWIPSRVRGGRPHPSTSCLWTHPWRGSRDVW